MLFGNISLGQYNVVSLDAPNLYFSFVKIKAALIPALFGQCNGKHVALFRNTLLCIPN